MLGVACSTASSERIPAQIHEREALEVSIPPQAESVAPAALSSSPHQLLIAKRSFSEHPANHVWVFEPGKLPFKLAIAEAEQQGYTVIDLGNRWIPYIFSEKTAGHEDYAVNAYRQHYVDLANDRVDSDGDPLSTYEHNFLELYGIPPTFAVLYKEWQAAETTVKSCLEAAKFDSSVFHNFSGSIAYKGQKSGEKQLRSSRSLRQLLLRKMRKLRVDSQNIHLAATHPQLRSLYQKWRELQDRIDVIDHAQRRFRCERLFVANKGQGKFVPGVFDSATTHALANFEKKHNIMGWGHFKADNLEVLGLSPEEGVYRRLLRVVEERTVDGAAILEDGSARAWQPNFRWTDAKGVDHPLPDMVRTYTDTVIAALGLETLAAARNQLDQLAELDSEKDAGNFETLLIAVRLPPLPEYYQANMDFRVVIDRGDIWYDLPFDEQGQTLSQPRKRTPRFTLYATYLDQQIPLVHWRTTIGSWRNEMFEGKVHYKYKNSDVGPRVWKEIMAAPTWLPPATTPPKELIKRKYKDGKLVSRVNYDEMGPGYQSAYGLVAAYHVKEIKDADGSVKAYFDYGIRTHGSVDYMSILRRFSHGCHRLYNMNAVRMFSFILLHRDFKRHGQTKLGYGRKFEYNGKNYYVGLKSRGYLFELDEPIPVMVTEGRILGQRKVPYAEYVRKPGVEYEDAMAEEMMVESSPNGTLMDVGMDVSGEND